MQRILIAIVVMAGCAVHNNWEPHTSKNLSLPSVRSQYVLELDRAGSYCTDGKNIYRAGMPVDAFAKTFGTPDAVIDRYGVLRLTYENDGVSADVGDNVVQNLGFYLVPSDLRGLGDSNYAKCDVQLSSGISAGDSEATLVAKLGEPSRVNDMTKIDGRVILSYDSGYHVSFVFDNDKLTLVVVGHP